VNWADLVAAQGAFGADFYDRSILRPKHRAYYRSGVLIDNRYLSYKSRFLRYLPTGCTYRYFQFIDGR